MLVFLSTHGIINIQGLLPSTAASQKQLGQCILMISTVLAQKTDGNFANVMLSILAGATIVMMQPFHVDLSTVRIVNSK